METLKILGWFLVYKLQEIGKGIGMVILGIVGMCLLIAGIGGILTGLGWVIYQIHPFENLTEATTLECISSYAEAGFIMVWIIIGASALCYYSVKCIKLIPSWLKKNWREAVYKVKYDS